MQEEDRAFRVEISRRASQMLVSHAAFLAETSIPAAQNLVTAFENAANSLQRMPHRCPWLIGEFIPRNMYRYLIFDKRYLMIYQIQDHTVYVDFIVDGRQDYGWLLR